MDNRQAIFHHSAIAKSYWTVKRNGEKEEYNGKFGKGYIVHLHMRSPKWHKIEYYIFADDKQED